MEYITMILEVIGGVVSTLLLSPIVAYIKAYRTLNTFKGIIPEFYKELKVLYNHIFNKIFNIINPITKKRINIKIDSLKMTKINGKLKLQFELSIYNYNYKPVFIDIVKIIANIQGEIGNETIEIKDTIQPLETYQHKGFCYIDIDETNLKYFTNKIVNSTYEISNKYSIMPIMFEIFTNVELKKNIYDKYKATPYLHPELYNLQNEYVKYKMLYKEN